MEQNDGHCLDLALASSYYMYLMSFINWNISSIILILSIMT